MSSAVSIRAVLDELAERRHIDEGPWSDPDFVFVSPQGKRWDERNFARAFDRLRRKAHKDKKHEKREKHDAALALYDMVKAVDRSAVIEDVKLLAKSGGKSGTYIRAEEEA